MNVVDDRQDRSNRGQTGRGDVGRRSAGGAGAADRDRDKEEAIRAFVEDVGLLSEESGLPRMAGRILGHLLICDPPRQSAGELQTALGASKGSISTMLRLLTRVGVVQKVGVPGERRAYYRVRDGSWVDHMRSRLEFVSAFRRLAERGLALLADRPASLGARLKEMHDLHAFWEQELPVLLDRYERERRGGQP